VTVTGQSSPPSAVQDPVGTSAKDSAKSIANKLSNVLLRMRRRPVRGTSGFD
jgi:hypothetical protein